MAFDFASTMLCIGVCDFATTQIRINENRESKVLNFIRSDLNGKLTNSVNKVFNFFDYHVCFPLYFLGIKGS